MLLFVRRPIHTPAAVQRGEGAHDIQPRRARRFLWQHGRFALTTPSAEDVYVAAFAKRIEP